ncbi:MAG: conjugal transfer protein TrbL family protein [Bacilli bacterium]
MGAVISDLLRNVFIFIDSVVYNLIGKVYELFISIANTTIISEGTINTFANRVYALLAVFMLFRLSFSVLTYIINPDNINDKSGGGGKLIGNILITIILLISVPWLFGQVWDIQKDLLNDNIIGKIILGNTNVQASEQLNAGDNMAWVTFSAFFHPTVGSCADNPSIYNEGSTDLGGPCYEALNGITDGDTNVAVAYARIEKSQLVSAISDSGLLNIKDNDEYVFEYLPFISTIAGGFIVYILLLFCIQIAVRSVKLGVLQLIAPIPVISYLDPKQGKDGMFKKWLKVCGKTFADLFIRLAAIYFAIFIITEITSGGGMTDITTGTKQTSLLVKVLIILGALTFAKELPKFIEEITGIKLDGGFSLNPFKNNPVLSGLAGGLMGAGMGVAGALTGAGAMSGLTGAFRGMKAGFGGKKLGEIRSGQTDINNRMRTARMNGSTFGSRLATSFNRSVGLPTKSQQIENRIQNIDDEIKGIDNKLKPTQDSIADRKAYTDKVKAMEDRAVDKIKNGEAGNISTHYKELENRASELRDKLGRGEAGVTASDVANAEMAALDYLNNNGKYDYIDTSIANGSDAAMIGMYKDLESMASTTQTYKDADGNTVTIDSTTVRSGAAARHSNAGKVTGTVNDDTRTIINPAEADKQKLSQEKAALYEEQRKSKANEDAIKR